MISGCGRKTCCSAVSLGRCTARSACQIHLALASAPPGLRTANEPAYCQRANSARISDVSWPNTLAATSLRRGLRRSTTVAAATRPAAIAACLQDSSRSIIATRR